MAKNKLGKGLAAMTSTCPAVLSTEQAARDDAIGAAMRIEETRYERAILDFETEIRRRRDAMRAEHLENMRVILAGGGLKLTAFRRLIRRTSLKHGDFNDDPFRRDRRSFARELENRCPLLTLSRKDETR